MLPVEAKDSAEHSIRVLKQLGFSQKQIAAMAQTCGANVSRILSDSSWSVSPALAARLQKTVSDSRAQLFSMIICHLPILILETCNRQRTGVDEATRIAASQAISAALGRAYRREAYSIDLPDGIAGVLAVLGDPEGKADKDASGMYIIAVREKSDRRVLAHELEHLAARLRNDNIDDSPQAKPAY